jgi:hypothetical protein
MKLKKMLVSLIVGVALLPTYVTANTITTTFGTNNGNTISDRGSAGFDTGISGVGLGGDTINNIWTWYTSTATTSSSISVPFGNASTATVREQAIRNVELTTNAFFFGWGGVNNAIALLGRYVTDAGNNTVSWTVSDSNLKTFYRNNNGAWQALVDSQSLSISGGTFDVLFVGNDNVDSNSTLSAVTVTGTNIAQTPAVPEPSSIALMALGLLGFKTLRAFKKF